MPSNIFIYNCFKCFERTINCFVRGCGTGELDVFESFGEASLKKVPFYLSFLHFFAGREGTGN